MKKGKELYLQIVLNKNMKPQAKIVSFNGGNMNDKLSFHYNAIDCRVIDIVRYNEDLDLIIDDEGLFVTGNPLFEIPSKLYVEKLQIAGSFLIGKRMWTKDGYETVGFESEGEINQLLIEEGFEVGVVGVIG